MDEETIDVAIQKLDKTRQNLLDHIIAYKSDNTEVVYFYQCIMDRIKEHKIDIDNVIKQGEIGEDVYELIYNSEIYIKTKKLIEELKEANKELWFDDCKNIDLFLVELINELFPHKTDKFFDLAYDKVEESINNKGYNVDTRSKRKQFFNDYVRELKAAAKELSQSYIKKEFTKDTNIFSDIESKLKEADTLHDIKSKLKELEVLYNTNNIGELTEDLIAKQKTLDTLFNETSETAKKITGDYETLTKQWVVQDFKSKVDILEEQRKGYSNWYVGMIIINIVVIIACVLLNIFGLPKLLPEETLTFWQHFSAGVLLTTPVVATLFWLTRYFNRRVHELIHLKEDYEHKYLAMLVFDGFKETVKSYDEKVAHEYLMKVISTITENPTHCLSRKKTDKIPTTEIADIIKLIKP